MFVRVLVGGFFNSISKEIKAVSILPISMEGELLLCLLGCFKVLHSVYLHLQLPQ